MSTAIAEKSKAETYSPAELDEMLKVRMKMNRATVRARFVNEYAGGQPATEQGVRAFAEHHLKLVGAELETAIKRIMGEEVRLDKDTDEVEEKASYGLNVIRRTEEGYAYIGTWQVRAMLKQAASRIGIFQKKKGTKGDMSEAMIVEPHGISKVGTHQQIVMVKDGQPYSAREYHKFMGCVQTQKGKMSIVCDTEVAPPGCEFECEVQWPGGSMTADDMATTWALAQRVGLGSVKAMENGRFEILSLEIVRGQPEPDKAA